MATVPLWRFLTKRVVHEVEEAVEVLEFCESKGFHPINENWGKYLKTVRIEKVSDPILEITQKMKLKSVEDGKEKFIRCHSCAPRKTLKTDVGNYTFPEFTYWYGH